MSKDNLGIPFLFKNQLNNGGIYCDDIGGSVSMLEGKVSMDLILEDNLHNGIIGYLNHIKNIEYFIFGFNASNNNVTYPSVYGKFTSNGIEFGLWNSNGNHVIKDNETNINKNNKFRIEFVWNHEGLPSFDDFTMGIKINNSYSVVGDPVLKEEDLENTKFSFLNHPNQYSKLNIGVYSLDIGTLDS